MLNHPHNCFFFLSNYPYLPTYLPTCPLGITRKKLNTSSSLYTQSSPMFTGFITIRSRMRRTLAMRFNGIGPMLALICLTWALIPVQPNAMGFTAIRSHMRWTLAMHFNGIGPMLALICLTWALIPVKPNAMGFTAIRSHMRWPTAWGFTAIRSHMRWPTA